MIGNNEEYERLLKLLDKKKQEIDERVAVRLTGEVLFLFIFQLFFKYYQ